MFLAAAGDFGESFVLELVGLALVVALIAWKLAPPIARLMNAQAEKIRAQLAAGEEARAEAERLVQKRREALEEAKREAEHIVEQGRRSAEQIAADGERRAEAEYGRIVQRAAQEIASLQTKLRDQASIEAAEVVLAAAGRVVEEELDAKTRHRLIDEAIAATESERAS